MSPRIDPSQWRTKDEAYEAGHEDGWDRGYEEGLTAAAPAPAPRTVQERSAPVPASGRPTERTVVKTGLVLVLAYGAWRLLKTWPGRLVAVGTLFVLSGLVSLGLVVLALVVGAVVVAWAMKTGERAVADTKSAVQATRAVIGARRS